MKLARIRAGRASMPPLFCAPLLAKDNYDVAGMSATAGAVGLADNFATQNAFVVRPPSVLSLLFLLSRSPHWSLVECSSLAFNSATLGVS